MNEIESPLSVVPTTHHLPPNSHFLTWVLIALCLRALVMFVAALKLSGVDPFGTTIPYSTLNLFAEALVELGLLSGLLAGGVAALGTQQSGGRMLAWAGRLWSAINIAALAAGVLGLLESRTGFALPPLLDVGVLVVLALVLIALWQRETTSTGDVWFAGMVIVGAGTAGSLFLSPDFGVDRLLHAIALNLRNIGWMVAVVSVVFWLVGRFSRVEAWWARMGVYTCGGLMAAAGAGAAWPGLEMALLTNGIIAPPMVGVLAACALVFSAILICAHLYRALSDRVENDLLIAHWIALFAPAFLLGAGMVAVQAWPGVQVYTTGTRLADVGAALWQFALVALTLGVLNQVVGDSRAAGGQTDRLVAGRVAGLSPFWLIGFGHFAGALVLAGIGLVQVYLQRLSGIGYRESEALLMPIYGLWAGANGTILIGLAWIALSYAIRRPKQVPTTPLSHDEATAMPHAPERASTPAS